MVSVCLTIKGLGNHLWCGRCKLYLARSLRILTAIQCKNMGLYNKAPIKEYVGHFPELMERWEMRSKGKIFKASLKQCKDWTDWSNHTKVCQNRLWGPRALQVAWGTTVWDKNWDKIPVPSHGELPEMNVSESWHGEGYLIFSCGSMQRWTGHRKLESGPSPGFPYACWRVGTQRKPGWVIHQCYDPWRVPWRETTTDGRQLM